LINFYDDANYALTLTQVKNKYQRERTQFLYRFTLSQELHPGFLVN